MRAPCMDATESSFSAVLAKPRSDLLRLAVARGCRHYAGFVNGSAGADDQAVPHEALGCALLCGPPDVDSFQAIRVAAMVLSDLENSPAVMVAAANQFGVTSRLTHLCQIACDAEDHPEFWSAVRALLPPTDGNPESDFLPGVSRFSLETTVPSPSGLKSVRVWLRTSYPAPRRLASAARDPRHTR
jgi:hypothetical protein